jgi:hypothetical protein
LPLLTKTAGLAAAALIFPVTHFTMNWAWPYDTIPNLVGITLAWFTSMLCFNLDGAHTFLHTITTALRAFTPRFPFIPLAVNWTMGEEAVFLLLVRTCICWACHTTMFCLHSDLPVPDLLSIATGSGAVAPHGPLREFAIDRAWLVVAVAFMHHGLVQDARLTRERVIEVTLSTTMLWRDKVITWNNLSASTTCHTARLVLLPCIRITINWAREGIAVNPAIQLLGAWITTKLIWNLDVALLLLRAATT